MSAYNKFITNNFMTDKGVLFLPLKQYEDKMIGTKNNLTLKELNEVHTEGFVKQNDGKIYNMIADNETTHLELRLKYTDNIVCLDIDGLNENGDISLEQFLEKCPEVFKNFPYTLSRKKKLPHFYFKLDGIDIQSLKGTYVDCFNNMKADILFNHAWEKRDAEMFNYNDKEGLPFIDYEDIKHLIKPDTFKVREPTTKPKEYNTNNKKDETILDLIDVKYWDYYESWKRLLWAMKNEGYSEETARKYSMKSSKYDDDGFNHFWDKPPFQNDLTQGTINYYAKLSDKDKYYDIVTNYTDTTDNESISTLGTSENNDKYDKFDIHKFVSIKSNLHKEELEKHKDLSDYSNTKKKEIKEKMKQLEEEQMNDLYKKRKIYFEQFYSKIMEPSIFINNNKGSINILGDKDLKHQTNNVLIGKKKFIELWLNDINIKTYDALDFLPTPCVCDKNVLNTFNGFKIQNMNEYEDKQNDFHIFLDHLKAITGNDDRCLNYMIKYLAHMLQRPGEKMDVAIVIRSVQGIGKNIFFDNFGKYIIGDKYFLQTADIDKVIGRFNQNVNNIMVVMDEMSGKDGFGNSEILKNLITTTELNWERKGVDGVTIRNFARYFIFGNGPTFVKLEQTDRRYMVMEGQDTFKGNFAHFKKLDESFKDEKCCKDFYDYLMSIDLSEWNWRDRPITEAYKDMQTATIPSMALFLGNLCEEYFEIKNGDDDEIDKILMLNNMKKYKSNELYSIYKKYIEQYCGGRGELTLTKYGREIMKYDGLEKKRTNSSVIIQIDYEVLHEHLEKNGLLI